MPDNAKSPPEPSMEEIIASIGRIIAEDKPPGDPQPSAPARPLSSEKSDVLELTEAVDEDGSVRRLNPFSENAAPTSTEPPVAKAATGLASRPSQGDAATDPRFKLDRERIVSVATSGAAAAAFAQLGTLPRERRKEGELALGGADRTLEDIIRDMLRPLLQTWLDKHLPGVVERLVREEIARVMGDAGLR